MLRLYVLVLILLVIGCESAPTSTATSSAAGRSTASPGALLVFATWAADSKVTNGPEPGYKPGLSGLTGHDVQSASVLTDATGSTWLLSISFTTRGANRFAQLTRDNVAACPGNPATTASANCAPRHLGMWLGLTQRDIDRWEDPTFVVKVSQPYELGCLIGGSPSAVCSKFISDHITIQEITGGKMQIACGCTEQQINELAAAINSSKSS